MKKTLTGLVSLAVSATVLATAASAATFSDTSGHWAEDSIEQSVSLGYFKGNDDGSFTPDASITRGQFITTLGRAAEKLGVYKDAENLNAYNVSYNNAYYAKYIAWAVENEIANGYSDGSFHPDDLVTREQICAFIVRFMKNSLGYDFSSVSTDISAFSDSDSISSYAKDYVGQCYSLGLIKGIGDTFSPKADASRSQIATILVRFDSSVVANYTTPDDTENSEDKEETGESTGSTTGGATGGTTGGSIGGGSSGGSGTGGNTNTTPSESHTAEEIAKEAQIAGYLSRISAASKTSEDLKHANEKVRNCIEILIDCVDKALVDRNSGAFLSKEYVKSAYSSEIAAFKASYEIIEQNQDDKNSFSNVVSGFPKVAAVLDYFGIKT
jgi:uncharacterized membrane protein YgcG